MLPVTVKIWPLLTDTVQVEVAVLAKVIELIVALAVTVTVSPGRITTSSVEEGTVPPGQGAFAVVEFQKPSSHPVVLRINDLRLIHA